MIWMIIQLTSSYNFKLGATTSSTLTTRNDAVNVIVLLAKLPIYMRGLFYGEKR
jgi:hypothetical protein